MSQIKTITVISKLAKEGDLPCFDESELDTKVNKFLLEHKDLTIDISYSTSINNDFLVKSALLTCKKINA